MMTKLSKVHIHSFKSLHDRCITLTGRDLILGNSGTGKSAVIQAIAFAHHGFDPLHIIGRRAIADTLAHYGSDGELAVELEFDDGFSFTRAIRRKATGGATESIKIAGRDTRNVDAAATILAKIGSSLAPYSLAEFLSQSGEQQLRHVLEFLSGHNFTEDPRALVARGALAIKSGREDVPEINALRTLIEHDGSSAWLADFDAVLDMVSRHANAIICVQDSMRDLEDLAKEARAEQRSSTGAIQALTGQKESLLASVSGGRATLEQHRSELNGRKQQLHDELARRKTLRDGLAATRHRIDDIDTDILSLDLRQPARNATEIQQDLDAARQSLEAAIIAGQETRALIDGDLHAANSHLATALQEQDRQNSIVVSLTKELAASPHVCCDEPKINMTIAQLIAGLDGLDNTRLESTKRLDDVEVAKKLLVAECHQAHNEHVIAHDSAVAHQRELDAALAGACPHCGQAISPESPLITKLRADIATATSQTEAADRRLGALAPKLLFARNQINDERDYMDGIDERIAELTDSLAVVKRLDLIAQLASSKELCRASGEAAARCRAQLDSLQAGHASALLPVHDLTSKISSLTDEIAHARQCEANLARADQLARDRDAMRASLGSIEQLPDDQPIHAELATVRQNSSQVNDALRLFDEAAGIDKQVASAQTKLRGAELKLSVIDTVKESLRSLRRTILEQQVQQLEEAVTPIYSAVFPGWHACFSVPDGARPSLYLGVSNGTDSKHCAGLSTGELLAFLAGLQWRFARESPWRLLCLEQVTDHLESRRAIELLDIVSGHLGAETQIIATGHRHAITELPTGWNCMELS